MYPNGDAGRRLATRREGDYDDGHPTRAGAASSAPAAGLTGEVRHRRRVRTHPLAGGFVLAPPRVQPAAEAILDLCRTMADLLDQMAAGLRDGSVPEHIDDWLRRGRALGGEIERVDDALREAEDSIRLNPRGVRRWAPRQPARQSGSGVASRCALRARFIVYAAAAARLALAELALCALAAASCCEAQLVAC